MSWEQKWNLQIYKKIDKKYNFICKKEDRKLFSFVSNFNLLLNKNMV